MKTKSLCFRLTLMTGMILLLCSVAFTLLASYNAGKQLTAVAEVVSSEGLVIVPAQMTVGGFFSPTVPPVKRFPPN